MRIFGNLFGPAPKPRSRVTVVVQKPVPHDEVVSAPLPNPDVAEQTRALQTDLVQSILLLGRKSTDLKLRLAQSTLNTVNGRAKNHL